MKKSLLTMAAAAGVALSAMAGTPEKFSLAYDMGTISGTSEAVTGFTINVSYPQGDISKLILDQSKVVQIISDKGATYMSKLCQWDKTSYELTVTLERDASYPGYYVVQIPEALFMYSGGTKVSSAWTIDDALTIGNPAPKPKIDVISVSTINGALPSGGKLDFKNPDDWSEVGKSGTLTGMGSSTRYDFSDIFLSSDDSSMFTFGNNNAYITNQSGDAGYIQSVTGVGYCYFSMEPMTSADYYLTGEYVATDIEGEPLKPNGPAKYFFYSGNSFVSVKEMQVEWGTEPLEGVCAEPSMTANFDDCRSGTTISSSCFTTGATVWIHAVSSTGTDETVSGINEVSYVITGTEGTEWTITTWATKEGLNSSSELTETYTIRTATLLEPYVTYPSEDDGEHMPVNGYVEISNQNYGVDATVYYQINGGDVQTSTENPLHVRAVGQIGDPFEMDIWLEAEGFNPSEKVHMGAYLVDNKLAAPTITPNGGAVTPGTKVVISASDYAEEITYRVNGGEWKTAPNFWWTPTTIVVDESCTIEAYASPGDDEYASFVQSDIATAVFTVEVLADNEVLLDKEFFGIGNSFLAETYTGENLYGEYEYTGFCMTDNLNFADNFYEEDVLDELEWMRNTTATEYITAVKANMVKGGMAVFFADEKIELDIELFNDEREDYLVVGNENNGDWVEMKNTNFGGHKFFFARGFGEEATCQSFLLRFGKPDTVQTIESLTEADARYFTLDGLEVDGNRLTPGLYIRVLGSKAEKVLVSSPR